MKHLRMVTAYFPEGRETADKIDRIFGDKPTLQQALLLSTMVTCLDRLLLNCEPDSHSLQLETKLSRLFLSDRGWTNWSI
jgi:hypothetical protein